MNHATTGWAREVLSAAQQRSTGTPALTERIRSLDDALRRHERILAAGEPGQHATCADTSAQVLRAAQAVAGLIAPWADAVIHVGVVPQQAQLYPRPVILQCAACDMAAYWYPGENEIAVYSAVCAHDGRTYGRHARWLVASWNLNAPVAGVEEAD